MAPASSPTPVIEFPVPDASLTYQTPAPAAIVIQTQAEYTRVAEYLKTIKTFQRKVADWFAPHKKRASDAHRALCDDEKKLLQPSLNDEQRIKRALVAYTNEQDRLRREEQALLQREQREREETARLEQACALEREGHATGDAAFHDAAAQLMEAPIPTAPVAITTPAPPKIDGLSYRETYRTEVIDLLTLVKAIAAGHQPLALVCANSTVLDGLARSLKSSFCVPGVQLVVDKTPVTRTR